MRALIVGWFSFDGMGATAGDFLARDTVLQWLAEVGVATDVVLAPPFSGGIDWQAARPSLYSHLVFVCGPFGNGPPVDRMLQRYASCRLIGVNLTMIEPIETWNPFDLLLERDSLRMARPDLSFASRTRKAPAVGIILVHQQKEYGRLDRHDAVDAAIERLLDSREAARCRIDTRLDKNLVGLRSPAEVEALIACMDVVVTTRLHGLVLALKNGIPVVALDPILGGAKVSRQAETVGWPACLRVDDLSDEMLAHHFEWCLRIEARAKARRCANYAAARTADIRQQLLEAFTGSLSA
jgi:hypothetical protein